MIEHAKFMQNACDIYSRANHAALVWQLSRTNAEHPWINTKFNSITLQDYDRADELRGPLYTYGWIQGRGLEALVMHARHFESIDSELTTRLDTQAQVLYPRLKSLYCSHGGARFCYDENMQPVCTGETIASTHQRRDPGISTYSDLFVVKGLIAAAARFAPEEVPAHLASLAGIVNAILQDRFLLSEAGHITEDALSVQTPDYGPMMIAQGAASLLHQLDLAEHDTFSDRFVDIIFEQYLDRCTGLLANTPNGEICNIGHGIELAGFVFEIAHMTGASCHIDWLADLVVRSFRTGFNGTGLRLSVSIPSLSTIGDICPWWSLPESIRSASLGYEHTGRPDLLDIWRTSHAAFFENYWRNNPPIAYQSMTSQGPVDYVPATPDLDPGYHTGLSLLSAVKSAERQLRSLSST